MSYLFFIILFLIIVMNSKNNRREVSYEEGENFRKSHNINLFFETSAKSGKNVKMVNYLFT